MNAVHRPIFALGAPSSLEITTGRPCIRAAATMTLALLKAGRLAEKVRPFVSQP